MSIPSTHSRVAAVLFSLLAAVEASADDWPQWRGANQDGVWRETGIVERIPAAGLKILWRAKVGNGYSGPAVARGRVFVTDRVPAPKEAERVLCFEEATGRLSWTHSYPADYQDMEYGNGPRCTPTVYGNRVYTLGTQFEFRGFRRPGKRPVAGFV